MFLNGRISGERFETHFSHYPGDHRSSLTDQHVRGGQRRDEVVTGLPDGPVHDERHQNQYVARDGQHHAHADDHHDQDLLPWFEWRQHRREFGRCHRRRPVACDVIVDHDGTVDDIR